MLNAILALQRHHLFDQRLGAQLAEGIGGPIAGITKGTLAKITTACREQGQGQPGGEIAIQRQPIEIRQGQLTDLGRFLAGINVDLVTCSIDQIGDCGKIVTPCDRRG